MSIHCFKRISLKPGETRKVKVEFMLDQLAYYTNHHWYIKPGKYKVKIGASSVNIRLSDDFKVISKTDGDKSMNFRESLFSVID